MPPDTTDRAAGSTAPEDLFAELFTQVFGLEKALLLVPQYPVRDIYEGNRFVDFALRTQEQKVAFEIDGVTWHVPAATPSRPAAATIPSLCTRRPRRLHRSP